MGIKEDNSLRSSFISGAIWGAIEQFSTLFIGFIVTVLLARRLSPSDYGLINMLTIFTVIASVLLDAGFGQALIQKKEATQEDYSTVFYFNIFISIILYAALFFLSPIIAKFYNQPSLTKIGRYAFLILPINSFAVIQHTLLTKHLKIKKLSLVSLGSIICGGSLGLILAYNNFGVWALVFQNLFMNLSRVILLWIVNSWRPTLTFKLSSIKSIWKFSMSLLSTHLFASIFQNIYTILIGKFFSVSDVGYYNQAKRLESTASGVINSVVQKISFPAFAQIQEDNKRLKILYRKVINTTLFLNFFVLIILIPIASDLITFLFSSKWIDATPLFIILCLTSCLYPLHMINISILKAKGASKAYFYVVNFKYIVIMLLIFPTIKYSIQTLLWGGLAATFISVLVTMFYCGKQIGLSLTQQIKDIIPILICSLIMYIVMKITGRLIKNSSELLYIGLEVIIGSIIYFPLAYIFKIEGLKEICKIIKKDI